jgi:hypothetical protein
MALAERDHRIIKNPSLEVHFTETWHFLWAMQWASTRHLKLTPKQQNANQPNLRLFRHRLALIRWLP